MKALNQNEIVKKYLIFLGYFTVLILFSVFCVFLYLRTYNAYATSLNFKQEETEFYSKKRIAISARIDSINTFLHLLHTGQVRNDGALESTILKLKYSTLKEIEKMPQQGAGKFDVYKKLLANIEPVLDSKKVLQAAAKEEDVNKKKLMECNLANQKLRSN